MPQRFFVQEHARELRARGEAEKQAEVARAAEQAAALGAVRKELLVTGLGLGGSGGGRGTVCARPQIHTVTLVGVVQYLKPGRPVT